ncbi:hypothetical protein C6P45_000889 [Maudiozyma exigua]|uniref:Uncharacterized protein n=1 Tax=Maudiozyma exigua TaxID=34358 RepID=A0A9P6W2W4_MAUEX|nr:hypothetical protein C6P45_000889 [Kazachstania exigua]
MDKTFVLNELREEHGLVNCFVTINNLLLQIGTTYIRYGEYDGNTFNQEKLQYKNVLGYVIYATLYLEPLTRKQYLLLVMQDGRIELRDLEFNTIDCIETGTRLFHTSSIVTLFESPARILYVTLHGNDIYMIRLKINKDGILTFLHTENSLTLIQTLSSTIKQMEYTLEYDIYTNEEYSCISILSFDNQNNEFLFQAITHRSNIGSKNRNKLDWKILVPQEIISIEKLEIDPVSEEDKGSSTILMTAVENVGFFFFTLTNIIFLTLPDGFENYIEGTKMTNQLFRVQGSFLQEYLDLEENHEMELLGIMDVKISHSSVEFRLYTNTAQLLEIQLDKISEDEEKYIKYWGKFNLKNAKFVNSLDNEDKIYNLYYFEQYDQCLMKLKSDKLIIVQLGNSKIINTCKYEIETFMCQASTEKDSNGIRFIRSGFTGKHRYFIDQEIMDYGELYATSILYQLEELPLKIWTTTNDDIYWTTDSSDSLYCNDAIALSKNNTIHITSDGAMITDSSIIKAVNIWNDKCGNYAYLNISGELCWNVNGKILSMKIPKVNISQLTEMVIWSGLKKNGTNITIHGYDNQISIVTEFGKDAFQLTNDNGSFGSISSIFYHEVGKYLNILISDIHGQLWVIDGNMYQEKGCININSYTTHIVGLYNSDYLVVYSKDTLILLRPSIYEKICYEYISLNLSFNIASITTNYHDKKIISVTIVTMENEILKMKLNLNLFSGSKTIKRVYTDVLINKFVKLPCSNRYFIASYITFNEQKEERDMVDKSGLCVYDVYSQNIVTRYDIAARFQKVIISDICEGSYQNNETEQYQNEKQISFAKQLIFSQCFIVSLNYELCETDEGPKLLLFMLNSENGEIELQTNLDTMFNVNCLLNYNKNLFIVLGEYVQLFKLDYSVQENIFHIVEVSNRLYVSGYIEDVSLIPDIKNSSKKITSDSQPKKRLKREDVEVTKFVGANLLRGFYDYTLETTNISLQGSSYTFKPTKISHIHPVISDCNKENIITSFLVTEYDRFYYVLVCCGMNKIKIYYTSSLEEEYNTIEFYLPTQVTSCSVIGDSRYRRDSYNTGILLNNGDTIPLFSIMTQNGGHYSISITTSRYETRVDNEIDRQNMLLQLKYIGTIEDSPDGEDENNILDYQLIDNRIFIHNK